MPAERVTDEPALFRSFSTAIKNTDYATDHATERYSLSKAQFNTEFAATILPNSVSFTPAYGITIVLADSPAKSTAHWSAVKATFCHSKWSAIGATDCTAQRRAIQTTDGTTE